MSWITPRTWTTGEVVTAALLNEQIRDNENQLRLEQYAVLDTDPTDITVVNTTVETDLYAFTVPANTMGSLGMLHLVAYGTYLNNSGANRILNLRMRFGGNSVVLIDFDSLGAGSGTRSWKFEGWIANNNLTNAQTGFARAFITAPNDDALFGSDGARRATAAINTTVDQIIKLQAKHSVADANLNIILEQAMLAIYRGQ